MFKKRSVDEYFSIIKENYSDYIESHQVTQLAFANLKDKRKIIEQYTYYLKHYQDTEKNFLSEAIRRPTLVETLGKGSFSALLGMGVGATLFLSKNKIPNPDLIGTKTAIEGGFAGIIGIACSTLIYEAWRKSDEKPAAADAKTCEAEMQKAGFNQENYLKLSENLVKLFYFRECLLLGLDNQNKVNMRTAFKNQYYHDNQQLFQDDDFNLAIEIYFLEQLSEFFNNSFEAIHRIHKQKIEQEEHAFGFIKWLKRYFEKEENRRKFTQQLQTEFMNTCIRFLEQEMDQPGFLGKYPYFLDTVMGLIAGFAAISILTSAIPFLPEISLMSTFGLICIAVISGCLGAAATHITIMSVDALYYKRDQYNRNAIRSTINSIRNEQKRLTNLMQHVVETTSQDIAKLRQYEQENDSCFLRLLSGKKQHTIAAGSVRAWIREFISRFRESQFIAIDLSDRVRSIITSSYDQTQQMHNYLSTLIRHPTDEKALKKWQRFINDTKMYLNAPENANFIKTFNIVQKIKEQFLEIVSQTYDTLLVGPLPDILIKFYTAPVAKGGLGGNIEELRHARIHAANVLIHENTPKEQNPYDNLLEIAFEVNLKLNANYAHEFIFQGDECYRKILGLPPNHDTHIENQLTVTNIEKYLNASFDFLYSLNYENTNLPAWDVTSPNSAQFMLYRMLLVKQLANLANPMNERVDPAIKQMIKTFAQIKLKGNSDKLLQDVFNQAFLITPPKSNNFVIHDRLGQPHTVKELTYITDALRVDMTYMSTSLSIKQLVGFTAEQYLQANHQRIILGYNSSQNLTAEFSEYFYKRAQEAVTTTRGFIQSIEAHPPLQLPAITKLYQSVAAREINNLCQQINVLLTASSKQPVDEIAMQTVLRTIVEFGQTLPEIDLNQIQNPLIEATPSNSSNTDTATHPSRSSSTMFVHVPSKLKKITHVLNCCRSNTLTTY